MFSLCPLKVFTTMMMIMMMMGSNDDRSLEGRTNNQCAVHFLARTQFAVHLLVCFFLHNHFFNPFLPCRTRSFLVCAKNGYAGTFWSTSPGVFLFTFLLVVFGKVRILVFISFCGTTKNFNLCVVAFKFASSFPVSPRLVAMFLLPQNKLQRRFQVTWGLTFCTTVELWFFLIKSNISKKQSSSSFVGQSDTGSPSIGFRNSVFLSVRIGNCTWHM